VLALAAGSPPQGEEVPVFPRSGLLHMGRPSVLGRTVGSVTSR